MDSILFVIVLYNRTILQSSSFLSLYKQVAKLRKFVFYFYDNSPIFQKNEMQPNCVYVHDSSNGGVSRAYNMGARYAREHGYQWLLFLDQDTSFPQDYIKKLMNAVENNKQQSVFVPRIYVEKLKKFISPGLVSLHRTIPHNIEYNGICDTQRMNIINSGLCISVESFYQVGGYNEEVYLDFSDTCFWEKLREKIDKFYVLDVDVNQDFSAFETDMNKALARFRHYCICAQHYPKESIYSHLTFLILMIGKTTKMTFRYKSVKFIFSLIHNYFIKK